jgi:hypothetical protein
VLQQRLERNWARLAIFAAGPVGSMRLKEEGPADEDEAAARAGQMLADHVARGLNVIGPDDRVSRVEIAGGTVEVDLPPLQYRISEGWRLSPVAARHLHGRKTFVQFLRIDGAILIGMPCDYSGELAVQAREQAAEEGLTAVVTSFNGDYIGYVLPHERYSTGHYEARDMNLFGPWCGEYLGEVVSRIIECAAAGSASRDSANK